MSSQEALERAVCAPWSGTVDSGHPSSVPGVQSQTLQPCHQQAPCTWSSLPGKGGMKEQQSKLYFCVITLSLILPPAQALWLWGHIDANALCWVHLSCFFTLLKCMPHGPGIQLNQRQECLYQDWLMYLFYPGLIYKLYLYLAKFD